MVQPQKPGWTRRRISRKSASIKLVNLVTCVYILYWSLSLSLSLSHTPLGNKPRYRENKIVTYACIASSTRRTSVLQITTRCRQKKKNLYKYLHLNIVCNG